MTEQSTTPEDYTLTTEEVRRMVGVAPVIGLRDWKVEFDRWLSAHDAAVRAEELERCAQIAEPQFWEAINKNPDIGEPLSWREHGYAVAAAIRALPATEETAIVGQQP